MADPSSIVTSEEKGDGKTGSIGGLNSAEGNHDSTLVEGGDLHGDNGEGNPDSTIVEGGDLPGGSTLGATTKAVQSVSSTGLLD
jgi:hypothetical protein